MPELALLLTAAAWLAIAHALIAQFIFSTLLAIAVVTSQSWRSSGEVVEDSGSPSLRSVAYAVPVIMFLQIALGASFRHGAIGGIPHITGAMLSMGAALLVCIFTLSQHSGHPILRRSAFALLSFTLLQIFLGLGAYVSKASDPSSRSTVLFTVSHLAVGTLTMAASVNLALQVSKYVRRITIVRVISRSAPATL